MDIVGDKWTLLITRDLLVGPRRFVELQRVLPGISTEQLRSRLNRMVADGLLTRRRYREVPPRVDYELTDRGHKLAPVLGALAQWGHEWAWTDPRPGERVDIPAIFRLAGALPVGPGAPGTVEMVLAEGGHDGDLAYRFEIGDDSMSVREGPAERPDARVIGRTDAWVIALSSTPSLDGLTITGARAPAERVLRALAPALAAAAVERAVA